MLKRSKRILGTAALSAALAFAASAASSSATVAVPLIDTNVPLYVLVDVSEIDSTPLGAVIIVR